MAACSSRRLLAGPVPARLRQSGCFPRAALYGTAAARVLRTACDAAQRHKPQPNAAGQAYNAIATATSGTNINLALCTSGHLGTKSVVIELVDDTGAALATPETNLADVTFVP